MKYGFSAISVAVGAFLALMAAALGQDEPFRINMWIAFVVLSIGAVLLLRRIQFATPGHPLMPDDTFDYFNEVIRYGVIASPFWGIAGFLVGSPLFKMQRASRSLRVRCTRHLEFYCLPLSPPPQWRYFSSASSTMRYDCEPTKFER